MSRKSSRLIQVTTLTVLPLILGILFLTLRGQTGKLPDRNSSSPYQFDQAVWGQDESTRAGRLRDPVDGPRRERRQREQQRKRAGRSGSQG